MQQRQHDLVMADQLDAFRAGPFQHVDARAVLRLLVEIDRHQAVEIVAEIVGDGDRLDEDFRHDDGAAEVHPDAVGHRGDDAAQAAEIDERGFAEGGAGDVRVHVDDVGAEGDVDGAGDAGAIGGEDQARFVVRAIHVVEMPAQRPAEAELVLRAVVGGDGEGVGGLAGHAEFPLRQLRRDVLAGLAGEGQLEVVDRRGAVHGDRLDDAALDPVDQIRSAAGLDDVAAQRDGDGSAFAMSPAQVIGHPANVVGGELLRQAQEPIFRAGAGVHRLAEIVVKDLRRPRAEIVGFECRQIVWLEWIGAEVRRDA